MVKTAINKISKKFCALVISIFINMTAVYTANASAMMFPLVQPGMTQQDMTSLSEFIPFITKPRVNSLRFGHPHLSMETPYKPWSKEDNLWHATQSLILNPNNPDGWGQRALTLMELKKYDEALENLDYCLSVSPSCDSCRIYKNMTLAAVGAKAEESRQANTTPPQFIQYIRPQEIVSQDKKALDQYYKVNAEMAAKNRLASLDEQMTSKPENAAIIWLLKSETLLDLGGYDEALKCADRCIAIDSSALNCYVFKMAILTAMGNFQDVVEVSDKVIELKLVPAAYAYLNKGNYLEVQGKTTEASAAYQKAIELDVSIKSKVNDAQCYLDKGNILYSAGKEKEADLLYNKAIEIDPAYEAIVQSTKKEIIPAESQGK